MRIPVGRWWQRLGSSRKERSQNWRDHFMVAGFVDDELVLMQTVERRFRVDPFEHDWRPEYRLKAPVASQDASSGPNTAEAPPEGAVILPFAPVAKGRRPGSEARLPPRDPAALRRSIAVFGAEPAESEEPTFRPSA